MGECEGGERAGLSGRSEAWGAVCGLTGAVWVCAEGKARVMTHHPGAAQAARGQEYMRAFEMFKRRCEECRVRDFVTSDGDSLTVTRSPKTKQPKMEYVWSDEDGRPMRMVATQRKAGGFVFETFLASEGHAEKKFRSAKEMKEWFSTTPPVPVIPSRATPPVPVTRAPAVPPPTAALAPFCRTYNGRTFTCEDDYNQYRIRGETGNTTDSSEEDVEDEFEDVEDEVGAL